MSKLAVECREWRPFRKNSLLGFAELYLPDLRLLIRGCTVNESNGRRWVGMPSKPMVDRDGKPLLNEHGKPKYLPFLQFDTREIGDAFSQAAIKAILDRNPSAFDGEQRTRPTDDGDVPF